MSKSTIEKYIKEYYPKIRCQFNRIKTAVVNLHNFCIDFQVYRKTSNQLLTICVNGFFIWVMLFPFLDYNPVWFIPSYGIVPWFVVNFIREIKE